MNPFLIIASFIFVYVSLTQRQQALYLLVGLLSTYLLRTTFFTVPTNLFELFVAISFITGLTQKKVRQSWLTYWQKLPFGFRLSLILFSVAAVISTVISIHLRVSLGILKGWVFIPMLFGFMVGAEIASREKLLAVIKSLVLSGVVVSLIGISQFGSLSRTKSIYDVPNSLALFIAPLLVATIWVSIKRHNYLFICASVIMAIALVGAQSVGGVVAVVASLLVGIILWTEKSSLRRNFLTAVACVLLVFTAIFWQNGKIPYLLSSFHQPYRTTSATVRLQLWSISWQLIKQHPFLGIGLGQFEPYYQQILHQRFANPTQHPIPEFVVRDPHSWPLAFYLNLGPLGLLAFIAINIFALKSGLKDKENVLTEALALALIAILVYGLTDTIYWKNDLATLWWILIAIQL